MAGAQLAARARHEDSVDDGHDSAAADLGRSGGKARAANLTPESCSAYMKFVDTERNLIGGLRLPYRERAFQSHRHLDAW